MLACYCTCTHSCMYMYIVFVNGYIQVHVCVQCKQCIQIIVLHNVHVHIHVHEIIDTQYRYTCRYTCTNTCTCINETVLNSALFQLAVYMYQHVHVSTVH